ncbi:MAG: DNA repair protein RadC [Microgenomates group bacterium]|nr:DNA repair protein RadC [Microgenomates group bacterium]
MKIKDLPRLERPIDKLLRYGVNRLTNAELLAIIFLTGKKGTSSLEIANRLFNKFRNEELINLNLAKLKEKKIIGPIKACQLIAALELGKRLFKDKKIISLLGPEHIWLAMEDILPRKKEFFVVFYLDTRNQLIKKEIISIGTLNSNLVHPREIFEPAIRNLAAQIILSHNHPSGNPEPSKDDFLLTKRLIKAGEILGIEVIDHVIVTKNNYFSMKEKGLF